MIGAAIWVVEARIRIMRISRGQQANPRKPHPCLYLIGFSD